MLLESKTLLTSKDEHLKKLREQWSTTPGLALVWIGDDPQTAAFVRVKQRKAKELYCNFSLHHFPVISQRQLQAVIASLNSRKDVHGIVLQLPLPKDVSTDQVIEMITPDKDVDGLTLNSQFHPPTALGIIELLTHNKVDLATSTTMILGDGRLVGHPLAEEFRQNNWPFKQIAQNAENEINEIRQADVLIAATGKSNLVSPEMVHQNMIVLDGSGIDVDVKQIEPLVAKITPAKGAIGPLTVCNLFENLLSQAR